MTPMTASRPQPMLGRELVQTLFVALRSAQIYEPQNATLQAAAGRLAATVGELLQIDGEARLEVGTDLVLVNDQRVRTELRSHMVHSGLVRLLIEHEIGGFAWWNAPDAEGMARFAGVVGRLEGSAALGVDALTAQLAAAGVDGVTVLTPREEVTADLEIDPDARARAVKTYRHSVAVTRQLMDSMRAGRTLQRSRIRRAVQSIVDQVLNDETLLVGLTNLRDYDEPTFTHSVNVCIFAISLGQKLGFDRNELYELGMAALLHDIGKVDVPHEILNKTGALSMEEWRLMRRHVGYGAWRLLAERGPGTIPIREALVAFEHHLHIDLSGYPSLHEPRRLTLFSKIIEICDSFDAGTTPRVYKSEPMSPGQMVRILEQDQGGRWDPILVKAFIAMLGIYPVGCVVLLDTYEIALVMAADTDPGNAHRPRVKLLVDARGNPVEGPVVSLADRNGGGEYERTVIKVLDPERYGIDVTRHFLG